MKRKIKDKHLFRLKLADEVGRNFLKVAYLKKNKITVINENHKNYTEKDFFDDIVLQVSLKLHSNHYNAMAWWRNTFSIYGTYYVMKQILTTLEQ